MANGKLMSVSEVDWIMKLNGKFQTGGVEDKIGFYMYDKETVKFQRFSSSTFRRNIIACRF
jgi:hypothetical protein